MAVAGEHHPALEEYCECIFELHEDRIDAIQARIAERLEVSRPAVSEMIRKLELEQLVRLENGSIRLTESGQTLAQRVVRRHRLSERLLTDVLGLSWADAHHEAGKWEHVLSPAVEEALDRFLHHPTTCPHGNPIPGSSYDAPKTTRLSDVAIGEMFVVSRVTEELEFQPGMLEFLENTHLVPGTIGVLIAAAPDGTMTVDLSGSRFGVAAFVTERILVTSV
jgi:DtxR family transcriptional regulator, Mn-dependent transcriptional regulator